jgi:hypothetical protein
VNSTGRGPRVVDPALGWSNGLKVEVGAGTLAHSGVVLLRLLVDRLGLTADLAGVVARPNFIPVRHRGRLLVDAACALASGASGLTDVEALTRQEEPFGPGGAASDTTVLRALGEWRIGWEAVGCRGGDWPAPRRGRRHGRRSRPGTVVCPRCGSPGPSCAGPGCSGSRAGRWWWSGWTPP